MGREMPCGALIHVPFRPVVGAPTNRPSRAHGAQLSSGARQSREVSREGACALMFARERTLGRGRAHTGRSDGLPWLAPALRRARAHRRALAQAIAAAERSEASR